MKSVDEFSVLLEAARRGDTEALGRLVSEFYKREGGRLGRQYLNRERKARFGNSDVIQEASLHACVGFELFRGQEVAKLFAWLERVYENTAINMINHHRAKKRDERQDGGCEYDDPAVANRAKVLDPPSAPARREEDRKALSDALAGLDPNRRNAWLLHHNEKLSVPQVAIRLGMSEQKTRLLIAKAGLDLYAFLRGKDARP